MRERRWLPLVLYGLLLATAVSGALKATRNKFKIATTSTTTTTTTTTEEPEVADNENDETETTTVTADANATTRRTLTGIPQIDYIWDPNLPRELNGFNLSDYPFYSTIPEEIKFKCDGLHDGFYASVLHKCQVYHHCLYGTRYDFLCANFTAFDQRTFICHFASEVDCANSKKFWHRNDALYKAAETTTTSTSTTSTTTTSTTTTLPPPSQGRRPGRPGGRRPFRRRPAYDYYEEDYYDDEAGYERTRPRGYDRRDDYDYDDRKYTRRDRDRDRDLRDRDYRDRDHPRSRDADRPLRDSDRPVKDEREVPLSPRERFPTRNNRRDQTRTTPTPVIRDTVDDEPRNRNRDSEKSVRIRDPEEIQDEKKMVDSRDKDVDDHRYSDKEDYYDDDPVIPGSSSSAGNADSLVKPVGPISSVYSRPRVPPKIRRPMSLAEQEKFSYKATSAPPIIAEARRRPTEIPADEMYYDDEIEEVRPRRPVSRRRPGFRDFYETPRERDRDRPYRSRYRDEEEDPRPKKHPERNRGDEIARPRKYPERMRSDAEDARPRKYPERMRGDDPDVRPRKHPERNRERYYERGPERGRDRSLDRPKERSNVARHEEFERSERPLEKSNAEDPNEGDEDRDRPESSLRTKEPTEISEPTRRPNIYDRTSVAPSTTSTTLAETTRDPSSDRTERPFRSGNRQETKNSTPRNVFRNPTKSVIQSVQRNPVKNNDGPQSESEKSDGRHKSREETSKDSEIVTDVYDKQRNDSDEYSSIEYYDDTDYQPVPISTPRTPSRIVKRPFLPSRGGNPNPRGLSHVGSKSPESSKKQEIQSNRSGSVRNGQTHSDGYRNNDNTKNPVVTITDDDKRTYDAYKYIQSDVNQKSIADDYEDVLSRPGATKSVNQDSRTSVRRPVENNDDNVGSTKMNDDSKILSNRGRNREEIVTIGKRPIDEKPINVETAKNRDEASVPRSPVKLTNHEDPSIDREKSVLKWNSDEYRHGQRGEIRHESDDNSGAQNRPKPRGPVTENSGYYSDTYAKENGPRDTDLGLAGGSVTNKQIINEVSTHHRLQDIPESEYDVTLNDALTPSFNNQEGALPSGFVLPIHRQIGRDGAIQSTENNYKVSRPYNQQIQHQQSQQQQRQKTFVPSPQFLPLSDIDSGDDSERSRSVQYFRTPEAVHVTGPQYRHQRGPWHDYTGY